VLIVAMPHSASTSLRQAVGRACKFRKPSFNDFRFGNKRLVSPEWRALRESAAIEVSDEMVKKIARSRSGLWCTHLIPVMSHLATLRSIDVPFVVHLRDWRDSCDADTRVANRKVGGWHLDAHKRFYDGWANEASSLKSALFTNFEDLVLNPALVVNAILEHLGVPKRVDADFRLPRGRKFTGFGLQVAKERRGLC